MASPPVTRRGTALVGASVQQTLTPSPALPGRPILSATAAGGTQTISQREQGFLPGLEILVSVRATHEQLTRFNSLLQLSESRTDHRWKSPYTKRDWTFRRVPLRMIPYDKSCLKVSNVPLYQQPCVHIALVATDEMEEFRRARDDLLAWHTEVTTGSNNHPWLIVHMTNEGKRSLVDSLRSSVFDKIRTEFGKNVDRCFQVKGKTPTPDQAQVAADMWRALHSKLYSEIFCTLENRVIQLEQILASRFDASIFKQTVLLPDVREYFLIKGCPLDGFRLHARSHLFAPFFLPSGGPGTLLRIV
eukprot:m.264661 g.264661  ORF g.264661 m.264661 type:complete len:303 (+) comp54668_c0_seq1:134-1042(+)